MKIKTCLLFAMVLYSQLYLSSMTVLHGIISGEFFNSSEIYVSVLAIEFRSVFLYCIDSVGNQFGIILERENIDTTIIRVNYNKFFKKASSQTMCGCGNCDGTMVNIRIIFHRDLIDISCNNRSSVGLQRLHRDISKDENSEVKLYPIPMDIINKSGEMYIMMGNIGPYRSVDNKSIIPQKERFVGCIDSFYYNNNRVSFIGNNTKLKSSCPIRCGANSCHGGVCRLVTYDSISCNCSSTAFNGAYCNRSMDTYMRGANNSYETHGEKTRGGLYVKMTWKLLLSKRYCLMEIVGSGEGVTIWRSMDNKLMMNTKIIADVIVDDVNFINVAVANGYLTVKINNNNNISVPQTIIRMDGRMLIHVGLSKSNNVCHIFEGAYDFHYDSTVLQPIIIVTTTINNVHTHQNTPIYIGVSVTIGCLVLFSVLVSVLYKISNNKMELQMTQLVARSNGSLNHVGQVFGESRLYGKVNDNEVYDSIEDAEGIYATVTT